MRAARVLDMLLTLQRRGRMTAPELARRLEVSERTILRDVEALGEAGVPIFTVRGVNGGIELMDGFETRLTGLTGREAAAMFLAGQLDLAARLGREEAARTARRKLLEALSSSIRPEASRIDDWFLLDPDPWSGHRIPAGELRRIARCIERRRVVELISDEGIVEEAKPLGLVLKAGSWNLVSGTDVIEVIVLDQLQATRLTRRTFDPPPGFSLRDFWEAHRAAIGAGR